MVYDGFLAWAKITVRSLPQVERKAGIQRNWISQFCAALFLYEQDEATA